LVHPYSCRRYRGHFPCGKVRSWIDHSPPSSAEVNALKPSGNYIPPALTILNSALCMYGFCMILSINGDYFRKQLIFVMVKCYVFFEVRTQFLNIIYTSFGF
jgi:hypothetical protein